MTPARTRIAAALGLALLMVGATLTVELAVSRGLIDADTSRRGVQVMIGLMLAGYANLMPKQIDEARGSVRVQAVAQSVLRVGGWALTLAGLTYAALWAFAPQDVAEVLATAAVAGATLVMVGYAVWSFRRCRTAV